VSRGLPPIHERILYTLGTRERSTADIAGVLRVHQTTVSREMRNLAQAGRVEQTGRRGNVFLYRAVELTTEPPKPVAPSRCTCGDLVTVHELNGQGMRARCSAGSCGCRLFVSAAAVADA
jgi:DNA-binding transcriptional ArsR family regulator